MKTFQNGTAVVFLALILFALPSSAQVLTNPDVNEAIQSDVSPPLGNMVMAESLAAPTQQREAPRILRPKGQQLAAVAPADAPLTPLAQMLAPQPVPASLLVNVLGIGRGFPGYFLRYAPSDANLAVGDTQVLQWVNTSYAVFDKTTGAPVTRAIPGNRFWAGFGGRCQTHNDGDPVVQWDKLAHRWVVTQNVFGLPFLTCIAISTTPDATGTYYRYAFPQLGGFPDYPKLGIQPDAYYQAQNDFSGGLYGGRYLGAYACAYERTKMLAGLPRPKQICFRTDDFDDSMLPADLDSASSPPPRISCDEGEEDDEGDGKRWQPEVFLGSIDNFDPRNSNLIFRYLFHVDFRNPKKSTFTGPNGTMPITVAPFALACGGFGACIPQPPPARPFERLDSLGDRLMYRLAYRNFGDYQSWVVSHAVTSPTGQVGERWYEFRAPPGSTNLTLYQQGTHAPDAAYRWMGSIAQDKMGNIALGYSLSSWSIFPSIFFTGRTATDPLGTLAGEQPIVNGTGSQLDTANRWGDYTSMALDAADDCTFWYTNQYYSVTDRFNWSTRIASIRFNNCR